MSLFLEHELSRLAQWACEGIDEAIYALPRQANVARQLPEYMHLDNFEDIVKFRLQPSQFLGMPLSSYALFNRETQETILRAVVAGNAPDCACRIARVPKKAWDHWVKLADEEIEPFYGFMLEVQAAHGLAEAEQVQELLRGRKFKSSSFWLQKMGGQAWRSDLPASPQPSTFSINQVFGMPLDQMKPEERAKHLNQLEDWS